MEVLIAGLVASTAMLFLLVKLNLRRCLGYDWFFDITLTVALSIMFSGTYAGMSAAMVAGLLLSVELVVLKKVIGAERFNFRTRRWEEVRKGKVKS